MNRLFIDSDIIIDLLARRENHSAAAALLTIIAEKKALAFTTPIVLANVDYIISKYSSKTKSRKAIKFIHGMISIMPVDEKTVEMALESEFRNFEDAIQYYSAEQQRIDFIVTRNKKDYKKGNIKVVTAQEYVNMREANL